MTKRTKRHPSYNSPEVRSQAELRQLLTMLREELGTKAAAEFLGMPAPSLRRLLGHGKTSGISLNRETQRKLEERGAIAKEQAYRVAIEGMTNRGTFQSDYLTIAWKYGVSPREVYTLGRSPAQMGVAI